MCWILFALLYGRRVMYSRASRHTSFYDCTFALSACARVGFHRRALFFRKCRSNFISRNVTCLAKGRTRAKVEKIAKISGNSGQSVFARLPNRSNKSFFPNDIYGCGSFILKIFMEKKVVEGEIYMYTHFEIAINFPCIFIVKYRL